MQQSFDVVIIGSGLGGLLSAVFLAKEGMSVAVIEQNKQIGGCLQTFSFDKKVFDSCVHYIGAMQEGQTQHRIFNYAGILPDLRLKQLDEDGFDRICFADESGLYPQAQGMENFAAQLMPFFKESSKALSGYLQQLKEVSASFPLYNLRNGAAGEKEQVSQWDLEQVLGTLRDEKLRQVLAGNSLLYAGAAGKTPFYVHALVSKSYIDSAYKCEGGSSQIAKSLWRRLQEYGGVVYRNETIVRLDEEQGRVTAAVTASGKVCSGKHFIANVHPAKVLEWTQSRLIRPNYRKRMQVADNSISAFMLNLVLHPGKVPYRNHNIYWNRAWDALAAVQYRSGEWPANYALYFGEDVQHKGYADTVAILTYMHASEFEAWQHTHNRTAQPSERDVLYHQFKEEKAQLLLDKVAERYPELKDQALSSRIATPLTFRDYMGSPDGSIYGIMADVRRQAMTRVPIRTKIPNLLLTGQNVGLHGVLGVSITAVATCGELLGLDYLLDKINNT